MKKKSMFFTLFVFLFGFLGGFFSLLPQEEKIASADTGLSNISVWDGVTPTSVTDNDFFQDDQDKTNYHIRTAKGLAYLAYLVNINHNTMIGKQIFLETDIDLNGKTWTPIGNLTYGFSGIFNGQGHSIYGFSSLKEYRPNECAIRGFFTKVEGEIKNLHFKNVNLTFTTNLSCTGTIVGTLGEGAKISCCSATGLLHAPTQKDPEDIAIYCVGGICGESLRLSVVENCYTKMHIQGLNCGGVCGTSNNMKSCANYSTIEASSSAGGIAMSSGGEVIDCFNFENVSAPKAGGIVGQLIYAKIINCYNTAEIVGMNAGGLVSIVSGDSSISNSFSINHGTDYLAFNANSNIFSHVYSDIESQEGVKVLPALAETGSISGISIAKTCGFYENPYYWADLSTGDVSNDWTSPWDFDEVWKISPSENNGFPMLKHLYDGENPNNEATYTISNGLLGSGTYLDPYQIWTAGDFGWLSFHYDENMQGKYFALQRNINLSGKTWKPLYGGEQTSGSGMTTIAFEGIFDGNGYTISGLTSSTQNTFTYYGLFGKTENAVIKNLIVDAKYLTPQTDDNRSGVLIGDAGTRTYIVNVVTLNDSIDSIGYISDNVYVAYGKLNEAYSKEITKTENADGKTITKIFDVTLNTNGGIVYDKNIVAYPGEPHILLNSSDEVFTQSIDQTFVKNLPLDTQNHGTKDIIARVGYKLYDEMPWSPSNIVQNNLLDTTAIWQYQGKQTFNVIYNGTEFLASNNLEAHTYDFANLQVSSNDVYIPVEFYYNDFYGNFSTLFKSNGDYWIPQAGAKILRDGYFDIVAFHKSNSTSSSKINGNDFCTADNLYAAWKGNEDKSYTITIKLESDPSDGFAKLSDEEIDRVIKQISIKFNKLSTTQDFDYNSSTKTFTFSLPATWVDEKGDAFNIKIDLREGYEFYGQPLVATPSNSHEDKSFGWRTPLPDYNTMSGMSGQNFQNFADDYTITLYAKKAYQKIQTSISNGTIYALTPNITGYQSIAVYGNPNPTIPTGDPAFGIDINGNYLFNNDNLIAGSFSPLNEYRVTYTINSSESRYIKYSKDGNSMKMYECNSSWTNTNLLAEFKKVNLTCFTYYYTNANFGIIAQVSEVTTKSFKNIQPTSLDYDDQNFKFIDSTNFYAHSEYSGSIGVQKVYSAFNSLEYTTSSAKILFQEEISSVILNTKFAYYNGSTYDDSYFDLKPIANDLGIELQNDSSSIINTSGGEFKFSLNLKENANKRYKLYNDTSSNLYPNETSNYNFKLVGKDESGADITIQYFSMGHSSDPTTQVSIYSLNTSGATPGNYTLYIYLTDIFYKIDYNTKLIYSSDSNDFDDFADATISRKRNGEYETLPDSIADSTKYGGTISSLLYDETLDLKAQLNSAPEGNANSYTFAYWYIEEISLKLSTSEVVGFSRDYNSTLANLSTYTIHAVYKQKNITLEFSDSILIQNYNGTELDEIVSNDNFVSSSFTSVSSAGSNGYNNFNNNDLTNVLKLTLSNSALNLLGYQVVDSENLVIKDTDNSDLKFDSTTINLQGAFERLRNAGLTSSEQTYYLMPIVSQKYIVTNYYSGTGTANPFGDQNPRGEVFNSANPRANTTNFVLTDTKYYGSISSGKLVEYSLNLNNSSVGGYISKNVFYTRTGHTKDVWNFTYSAASSPSDLKVNSSLFDLKTDVFAHETLNFYLTWTPNEYQIALNQNNATTYGSTSARVVFDSNSISSITNPVRIGYVFGGWTAIQHGWSITQDVEDIVIDTEGNFVAYADYTLLINEGQTNEKIIWCLPNDTILYAYWIPKVVSVSLNANGGTQEFSTIYIVYDGSSIYSARTGESYPYSVSSEDVITSKATRAGFNFLGYFNGENQIISSSGNLRTGWTLSDVDGTTLSAKWAYDESYFSLSFENQTFESLTFNGNDQAVELSELLTAQNTTISAFSIDFSKTYPLTLNVGANNDLNCTLSMSATLNEDILEGVKTFNVRNAGEYEYVLTITITDDIENQTIWENTYTFELSVERALLGITLDENKSKNLKRLMKNYVSSSDLNTIFADFDNANVSNRLKTFSEETVLNDITLTEEEQDAGTTIADKILDYFTTKYYFMAHVYTDYKTYKDWTYTQYCSYKEENASEATEILTKTKLFDYFDYTNNESLQEISAYDSSFNIFENDDQTEEDDYDPATTLSITSLQIVTDTTFSARQSYRIRAYITGNDLYNYQYSLDEEESPYIILYESLYLMPQILQLENQAQTNQSFYDGTEREIEWQGNRTSREYNETNIYRVNEDASFFVGAKLFTSNAGDNQHDTIFTFTNKTNYFYFKNINILSYNSSDETYQDLTNMFSLIVPEGAENSYTILGVSGVNKINVFTKSLTMQDGSMIFADIDGLVSEEQFVTISSITYTDIEGHDKTADFSGVVSDQQFIVDSVLLVQMFEITNYKISLQVSKQVKSVIFSTRSVTFDYFGLYTWSTTEVLQITGEMTVSDAYIFENISDENATNIREYNIYAIYTDLVLATYDLNLPTSITNSFATTAYIKRGETTAQNITKPHQTGLTFSKLIATGSWNNVEYTQIFTGEGQTYIGHDPEGQGNYRAYFAPVYFKALWAVEDIEYSQRIDSYSCQIKNFEGLYNDQVVAIRNQNERFYTYSYSWYKLNTNTNQFDLILNSSRLTLPQNGSYEESGKYKLVVRADAVSSIRNYLDPEIAYYSVTDASPATTNDAEQTILFDLNFMRRKVSSITLPSGQDAQATYANKDYSTEIIISYSYYAYLADEEDYADEADDFSTTIGSNSGLSFEITKSGVSVDEIKNMATYSINVMFDPTIFELEPGLNTAFEFSVLPKEIDLSGYSFAFSKTLNTQDPELVKATSISLGETNQEVVLEFTRAAGELVGQYNLYVDSITSEHPENFKLLKNDVVLYENATKTANASTTSIGTFTITKTGNLILSWTISSENPAILSSVFSEEGYTYQIDSNKNFILKNGATTTKQIALSVFDASTKSEINNVEILSMISIEFANSIYKFTKDSIDTANTEDCGTYSFKVVGSTNILNNFADIVFDSKHGINIIQKEISTSFPITKTFNNSKILNLTTQGVEILNLANWSDLYIEVNFATEHVGTNISVSLTLNTKDSNKHISNYYLSSQASTGSITKCSATFSATFTKASYVYGEVNYSNIKDIISSFTLTAGAENVTGWVTSGYYSIAYSVDLSIPKNASGYLYKGENIPVLATTTFADFEITNASSNIVNVGTIDITALQKQIYIPRAYIEIWENDTLESQYTEPYPVSQTNDSLTLTFNTGALTSDEQTSKYYAISLDQTSFLSGSVVISTTGDLSHGLLVYKKSAIVSMHITDNTIFTGTYNGEEYTIEFDNTNSNIIVKNGEDTIGTSSVVYKDENDNVLSSTIISSISIQSSTQMTRAGTYNLSVTASASGYSGLTFATAQTFTISPKTINVSNLTIEKTYNGYSSVTIEDFAEKVSGEDVYLTATFSDSSAGTNKSVTNISLNGADQINYTLSSSSTTGTINQATAQIILNKTAYIYGSIFRATKDFIVQGPEGKLPIESDVSIKYVLSTDDSTDATYSSLNYLTAGSYKVKIDSQINQNYNFVAPTETIIVSPYQWNIVLTTAGVVTAEYGHSTLTFDKTLYSPLSENITLTMTRLAGDDVGYYSVVSAVVKDNSNYVVASIIDQSEGYYQITKPQQNIYILASSENTINATGKTSDQLVSELSLDIEYDGNIYDGVKLSGDSSSGYKFIVYNKAKESVYKQFNLNAYSYDTSTSIYTKLAGEIGGLSGTFTLNRSLRYATGDTSNSYITTLSAQADNYNVGFGPYLVNAANSFYAKITPRQLYFKSNVVTESINNPGTYLFTKEFTNKNAVYNYTDALEVFDGFVTGETASLTLTFKDGENIAKNAGSGYTILAAISGEGASNYHTNIKTIVSEVKRDVVGRISKASMTLIINSQFFTYGEYTIQQSWITNNNYESDHQVSYSYSTNVDLTDYDTSRISIILRANYNPAQNFSSSNCLKAGSYGVYINIITLEDFNISKYISDGAEYDTWSAENAEVRIGKKTLSLSNGSQSLTETFTKKYDETTDVEIYDGANLKFNINGIESGDEFIIDSASYKTALPGASIEIEFTISGVDKENYYLSSYPSGVINPIKVNIVFDYDRTTIHSNVDNNNLPTLSLLNFPFVSQTYLTTNSAELNTSAAKNFPTSLIVAGKSFTGWRLNFENVVENSAKHTYLTSLSTTLNIDAVYEDETFGFKVGNDYKTISLLNSLIGADTEDVCGMYYKNHDNQTITFSPVWTTNKYTIEISIENAVTNQRSTALGEVKLESDGIETIEINKITPASIGNIQVEYHKAVVITATPKAHCYFYGFSGQGGDYSISGDDGEILTISNIQSNYTIKVKFAVINVQITYDLSDYENAEFSSSNFTSKPNRKYTWTTDYLSVENTKLSQTGLENITLEGYDFGGIKKGSQEILFEDFDAIDLVSLLEDGTDSQTNLPIAFATFKPIFIEKQIAVTLDYGYDDKTETIQIDFNHKYVEANDWDVNPEERNGYTFNGWYLDQEFLTPITNDTKVLNSEAHSVYAKWTKNKLSLRLNYAHATITEATIDFTQEEGYVSVEEVEFETEISFTITAEDGYQIKNVGWNEIFETSSTDGWHSAQVSFVMPGSDFEATLPVSVLTNSISFTLTHIKSVNAYDITNGEAEIEIVSNTFEIDTGKSVKIVATAEDGYEVSDELILVPTSIEVSNKTKTESTLTFEISGIIGTSEIQIFAFAKTNTITFNFESEEFEDGKTAIEKISIQDRTYIGADIRSFEGTTALTGQTLTGYLKLSHGYIFDQLHSSSEDYDVSFTNIESGAYNGWIQFTISNINKDGDITISFAYDTFEVEVEVIAYDASKNRVYDTDNIAYINGETSVSAKYNSNVELTFEVADNYSFVYWSEDGVTQLSNENNYSYKVVDNQIIYAIFSTFKYQLRFYAKELIKLERESGQAKEIYEEITTDFILPEGLADSLDLYYGQNATIGVHCPTGYYYAGMAFEKDGVLVYIDRVAKFDETIEITISSDDLSNKNASSNVTLYSIFIAKEATIKVQSYIDIDGTRLANNVGQIELISSQGEGTNVYGYIEGTLVHYSPSYFSNGQPTSKTNFDIITNTGKDVYIKISNIEEGYKFLKLLITNAKAEVVQNRNGILIYKITEIFGGDKDINVVVLFKPKLNNISITFESEGVTTRAGAFEVETTQVFENRIFKDTTYPSKIVVSAYTDTRFTIKAFIKAGYYIDRNGTIIVDFQNIVPQTSISYSTLDINETGYTGVLSFDVTNYKGDYEIKILVQKTKYVVALQEGDQVLAKIHNASFGSLLNLSAENSDNIEILDRRMYFEAEKLFVSLQKENCNFEGFFTYENGAGIRYIDSEGNACRDWEESGYILNTLTSQYELGPNAKFDAETGETTISLYIYWSYLKTRISFSVVPQVAVNFTAQELVKGIDYSNSWFYTASPMYIEVSFNTDIHIIAPEIYGYSFYKFIINQKDIDGTWLNPVVSYSNDIPWSTNDVDKIVECEIEVQYFAKVSVEVVGGQSSYTIEQAGNDEMARRLMLDGYVDTTKDFTIRANPNVGYEFQRWYDWSKSMSTFDAAYTSQTDRMMLMTLSVQGGAIDLSVPYFDQTYGKITTITSTSLTGEQQTYEVGVVGAEGFIIRGNNPPAGKNPIRVGDTIRLFVEAEYGFSILWNRSDILFEKYDQGITYFVMTIAPSMSGREIEIFPMFNSQILSIYISFDFEESEKDDLALDRNVASIAGQALYENRETNYFTIEKNKDIEFTLKANARYYVSSLKLNNYSNSFDIFEKLEDEDVVLTKGYLSGNEIVGTLQISVKFSRNYWANADLSEAELLGSGTARDPYRISSEKELTLIMRLINSGEENSSGKKYANCYYIVEKNLDLSEGFWTPIGTEENPFAGNFNFAGHNISGIAMATYFAPIVYNGLFGVVDPSARITLKNTSMWHIYLAAGLSAGVVVAVPTLTLVARRRRKRRQRLSTK